MIHNRWNRPTPERMDFSKGLGADQSFKDECDINRIMARYAKTGVLGNPNRPQKQGFFEDVSMAPEDFLEAQQRLQRAESAFMDLPSKVRAMFEHNPAGLMEWLSDEANHEEARKLGLMKARPEAELEPPASVVADGDTPAPKA